MVDPVTLANSDEGVIGRKAILSREHYAAPVLIKSELALSWMCKTTFP